MNKKRYFGVSYILIISGFAIAISLAIIIVLHGLESNAAITIQDGKFVLPQRSIWTVILEHVATAIFILGVWHTFDHILIRKEFNSEIDDKLEEHRNDLKNYFATAKHDHVFGLQGTHHEASSYGFASMIENSHSLTAVMADGYSWLSRHNESFIKRFEDGTKTTTIILVHPTSEMLNVISRKVGMSKELLQEKIFSTIREIRKLSGTNKNLKILGHSLINCHSVFHADREVVFSPYFLSSQRRTPPVIILKDAGTGSFYNKLVADISFLEKECLPIKLPEENG